MLLIALFKAFAQLGDPALRRVMWRGFGLAGGLFLALLLLLGWGLTAVSLFGIPWLDWFASGIGGLGALVLTALLFPGAVIAAQGLLLDDAAAAVERKHYPTVAARSAPLGQSLVAALRLAGLAMALNLLALPFYVIFPPATPFIFYGLNGMLLGREYFELVALRRMDLDVARDLRRAHRTTLFLAGVAIAMIFSIPIIGWFMPAFATAFMVHIFEALRSRDRRP